MTSTPPNDSHPAGGTSHARLAAAIELMRELSLSGDPTALARVFARLQEAYDAAEYELRTIAEFQQNLLPEDVPAVPGLDVAVHYRTAHRAGGDYYDFFPLSDGRLGVLVADVSGHGTPAAVLMAVTHSMTHALAGLQRVEGLDVRHRRPAYGLHATTCALALPRIVTA